MIYTKGLSEVSCDENLIAIEAICRKEGSKEGSKRAIAGGEVFMGEWRRKLQISIRSCILHMTLLSNAIQGQGNSRIKTFDIYQSL